jgi:hypothetical protein
MNINPSRRNIVLLGLVVLALFFALAPHSTHCSVIGSIPVIGDQKWCLGIDHNIHIAVGVLSFIGAIAVAQPQLVPVAARKWVTL